MGTTEFSGVRNLGTTEFFSQNFHNFGSTGPICTIFTFLEMASKFVGTSSSAEGRGTRIEAATAVHRFSVPPEAEEKNFQVFESVPRMP